MSKKILLWFFYALLLFLLGAAAVLLVPMRKQLADDSRELNRQRQIEESRRIEANKLESEVNALQNDPDAVEKVAREKYGMAREGETVLMVTGKSSIPAVAPAAGSRSTS